MATLGSLGGAENVPEALKNLKVMFGHLKGDTGVSRAALAPADEVVPLVKGARLG